MADDTTSTLASVINMVTNYVILPFRRDGRPRAGWRVFQHDPADPTDLNRTTQQETTMSKSKSKSKLAFDDLVKRALRALGLNEDGIDNIGQAQETAQKAADPFVVNKSAGPIVLVLPGETSKAAPRRGPYDLPMADKVTEANRAGLGFFQRLTGWKSKTPAPAPAPVDLEADAIKAASAQITAAMAPVMASAMAGPVAKMRADLDRMGGELEFLQTRIEWAAAHPGEGLPLPAQPTGVKMAPARRNTQPGMVDVAAEANRAGHQVMDKLRERRRPEQQ